MANAIVYSSDNPKGKVTSIPDNPKGVVVFEFNNSTGKVKAVTK